MGIGVYGWVHSDAHNGVIFHRVAEPLRVLRDQSIVDTFTGPALDASVLEQCDTVVVQMLHDEKATEGWRKLAALGTHRLVLDVDDAMWRPDWRPFRDAYPPEAIQRLLGNAQVAHVVTTPSEKIADYLGKVNSNVHLVPNTVPARVLDIPAPDFDVDDLVIGYQGSPSHQRDWPMSQRRQLLRFALETGSRVTFHGAGQVPEGWEAVATATPWQAAGSDDYYRGVAKTHIGIGPLADTYFNQCKSALRAIEYAALGVVAVLPANPPIYQGWVGDRVTGRLIRPHQTLRGVLHEVAGNRDRLAGMSREARQRAAHWTTEAQIGRWLTAWQTA